MAIVHVFHANGAAWIGMHRLDEHVKYGIKWFKMGLYIRTADIACEDSDNHEEELNQAYEDTIHTTEWWMANLNVLAEYWQKPGYLEQKPRSSSIGDIFILNGIAYMALAESWAPIQLTDLGLSWPLVNA